MNQLDSEKKQKPRSHIRIIGEDEFLPLPLLVTRARKTAKKHPPVRLRIFESILSLFHKPSSKLPKESKVQDSPTGSDQSSAT